jgi:hypothetical protein
LVCRRLTHQIANTVQYQVMPASHLEWPVCDGRRLRLRTNEALLLLGTMHGIGVCHWLISLALTERFHTTG